MKIGIITFHASHNYGSMLQAYALQTVLGNMGHDVEIINLRQASQKKMYAHPLDIKRRSLQYVAYCLLTRPAATWNASRKWDLYEKFIQHYLNLSKEYHSLLELEKANLRYDMLITGSDQIWNTHCKDFNLAYFGNFLDNNTTRKISYAPSMGANPEEKVDKSLIREYCKGFDAMSVREERTRRLLRTSGIQQEIAITADPTLLLEASDYKSLYSSEPLIKEDYIYYYDPFVRPKNLRIASDVGRSLGYPVICDRFYKKKIRGGATNIEYYTVVGPSEFLNLIDNAKVVCAHSFHSVVFSILMKKDFLAIDGDKDSRMFNLLSRLGLDDRIISLTEPDKYPHDSISNWDEIHARLARLREESLDWLSRAVNKK